MSVGGLGREQIHLCLPSTCLSEQRSTSHTGHWARIPGPSQETHTHTECWPSSALSSWRHRQGSAVTSILYRRSWAHAPRCPASPVPTAPAQAKPGEKCVVGRAPRPPFLSLCLRASGNQTQALAQSVCFQPHLPRHPEPNLNTWGE